MLPSAPVPRRPPRPWRGPHHRLLPGQGWSLLCNGVIVFDDTGKLLPDGRAIPRTGRSIPLGPPLNTASLVTTMPRRRAIAFRPPLTLISLGQAPDHVVLRSHVGDPDPSSRAPEQVTVPRAAWSGVSQVPCSMRCW